MGPLWVQMDPARCSLGVGEALEARPQSGGSGGTGTLVARSLGHRDAGVPADPERGASRMQGAPVVCLH